MTVADTSVRDGIARTGASGRTIRGDIEGLRAIAVATVLGYHVGVPFLPSGFAGVDVFFVLSGFLITSLLVSEIDRTGRVSLLRFYARRARRLLPAACLVLVVTTAVGWWVLPQSARHDLGVDVVGATLYVVNWVLAGRAVDYLAENAGVSPVQHYWSLSVEEQYYVVWPLLLVAAVWVAGRVARMRATRPLSSSSSGRDPVAHAVVLRRIRAALIGLVAVASLTWSIVDTERNPAAAYFVSTTRFWELAAGSLLALAVHRLAAVQGRLVDVLGWAGLAALVVGFVGFSSRTAWPGAAALVPVLGAVAVVAAGSCARVGPASRLLAWPPLVWLGGLSYSLYLWHWPVIVLARARFGEAGVLQSVAVVVVSVGLAWASKHLLEDPWRFSRALAPSGRALLAGGLAMVVSLTGAVAVLRTVPRLDTSTVVAGATGLVADPASDTWRLVADPAAHYTRRGQVTPQPAAAREDSPIYYGDGCQMGQVSPKVKTDCLYGDRSGSTTMVMLGDSKMGQWFAAMNAIAHQESWKLRLFLKSACAFSDRDVRPDCSAYTRNVLEHFRRTGAPDYAIVSNNAGSPAVERGLEHNLRLLKAMGTRIVVLADNPAPAGVGEVYDCVSEHPDDFEACSYPVRGSALNGSRALRPAARALDLPYVDLGEWVCPPGPTRCPAVIDHTLVYRQGSHLTDTYVRTLTPFLHRALSRLGIARMAVGEITTSEIPRSLVGRSATP